MNENKKDVPFIYGFSGFAILPLSSRKIISEASSVTPFLARLHEAENVISRRVRC